MSKTGLVHCSVLAAVVASGCTIMELNREEKADEARVHQREADLQAEQDRADNLAREKERLNRDLARRQLSLDELSERLDQLNASNARAVARNDAARQRRQQLIAQLHDSNVQLAMLQPTAPDRRPEQQAKIEYLKHQIDVQLQMLLQ